jgi:hypothetical protein
VIDSDHEVEGERHVSRPGVGDPDIGHLRKHRNHLLMQNPGAVVRIVYCVFGKSLMDI